MKVSFCAVIALAALSSQASAFTVPSSSTRRTLSNGLPAATLDQTEVTAESKTAPVAEQANSRAEATATEYKMEEQSLDAWNLDPKNRVQVGRYNSKENSIAVPFLKRPNKLDGSHAGDYGFDPLGFTETEDLYVMQEAELRHARLAMLAVIGWPMSELHAPEWMLQNGCAPSVLNGFNPVSFLATAMIFGAAGYFEYKTSLRKIDDKELGKKHFEDMANVWDMGVAGDYNFDPLDLYSILGDDALGRKGLREVEISHGRSAMLGITAFAMWEYLTGHPIVENSMFFHPNLLLPALTITYVAATQIYEFKDSDQYIGLQVSSEGEARLENLKRTAEEFKEQSLVAREKAKIGAEKAQVAFVKATEIAKDLKEKYNDITEDYTDNVMKNIKEA